MSVFEMVRSVVVKPIRNKDEIRRFDALMREHHYLGLDTLVGENVRYVAEIEGEWVALLGWCAAALTVTARDRYVGWDDAQRKERLRFVAQNARFLILPGYNVPNMASRVLAKNLQRLNEDWQSLYGHPIVMAETFVDPAHFAGTLYKASGWTMVGETSGYGRKNGVYVEHGQPKQVYLRPLFRRAREVLAAPHLSPELQPQNHAKLDINQLSVTSLVDHLRSVPDPRKRRGVRHSFVSVLAICTMAVLQGAKSVLAIADFAQGLTPALLKEFGAFRSPSTGKWMAPSEPTIRRTISHVDGDALDDALGAYLGVLRPPDALGLDGKTLRGSKAHDAKARHLMAAVRHDLRVVLAQREVGEKSNEIPLAPKLLAAIDDLTQTVVTADALHTQTSFARHIVEDRGSNYVLTVKDNQPSLHQALAALDWRPFPPVHDAGEGPRPHRDAFDPGDGDA